MSWVVLVHSLLVCMEVLCGPTMCGGGRAQVLAALQAEGRAKKNIIGL